MGPLHGKFGGLLGPTFDNFSFNIIGNKSIFGGSTFLFTNKRAGFGPQSWVRHLNIYQNPSLSLYCAIVVFFFPFLLNGLKIDHSTALYLLIDGKKEEKD